MSHFSLACFTSANLGSIDLFIDNMFMSFKIEVQAGFMELY
jgi:hypothetical protein